MVLNNPKFLLVQGRALPQEVNSIQYFPPNWRSEFPLIQKLGFFGIEWIYDKKSEYNNPILNNNGRKEMIQLSLKNRISLENIVFDWFLIHPLLNNDDFSDKQKIEKLLKLIELSAKVGFKRIILPMLEQNSLSIKKRKLKFIDIFRTQVIDSLTTHKIEMHLETDLTPQDEFNLIKEFDNDIMRICYDIGNSASFGFPPSSINIIKDHVGSVHIKDRIIGGDSVPLGQGSVDFLAVFSILNKINFDGPYTFQVYRNKKSNNIDILEKSIMFINNIISQVVNDKSKKN